MTLRGRVVRGSGRGRGIGVPTANLNLPMDRRVPRGVFSAEVTGPSLRGPLAGVCNIGSCPTVGGVKTRIEVHIPGFRGNLYGRTLIVRLLTRIRGERRFSNLQALAARIRKDILIAVGPKGPGG